MKARLFTSVAFGLAAFILPPAVGQPPSAKLMASDGALGDEFGQCVAVSVGTPRRIVIGASYEDPNGVSEAGAAYVYRCDDAGFPEVWVQEAKLTASPLRAGQFFGRSVAIDTAGDTVVVGAWFENSKAGAAYVFERDPNTNTWNPYQRLTASDGGNGDYFGSSVAISGQTIMIGAYGNDDLGEMAGKAYVFHCANPAAPNCWLERATLCAGDGDAADGFGSPLALSGDVAVIAASGDELVEPDPNAPAAVGSAYVFRCAVPGDPLTWSQEAKLYADDGEEFDWFGCAVDIEGDAAIIGAFWDGNRNGAQAGAAYAYRYDPLHPNLWRCERKLRATDGQDGDVFGCSVSLAGNMAMVGAYGDDDRGLESGSAYVFWYDGNQWYETTKLNAGDGAAGDYFGTCVAAGHQPGAMRPRRAVVGASLGDGNCADSGAAYSTRLHKVRGGIKRAPSQSVEHIPYP